MQVNKIKCELFIQDVPNHQTHKKILLDLKTLSLEVLLSLKAIIIRRFHF